MQDIYMLFLSNMAQRAGNTVSCGRRSKPTSYVSKSLVRCTLGRTDKSFPLLAGNCNLIAWALGGESHAGRLLSANPDA